MWLLRLLAVLTVIAVASGIFVYAFTGSKKYLQFSWRVFCSALVVALLIFALMILERVVVISV